MLANDVRIEHGEWPLLYGLFCLYLSVIFSLKVQSV